MKIQRWNNHIISETASLLDALKKLNTLSGKAMTLFATDNTGKMVGTITDGDIRRSIIAGATLETPVREVMHRNFRALRKGIDLATVRELRRLKINLVPVLANEKSSDNRFPFYFTAGESFGSPVAWMQKAAQEWQTVIENTKFVRTPIRMQLYLPHSGARIVNIDEMMAGPWAELDLQVLDRSDVHEHIRSVMLNRVPLSQEWQRIVSMVRERMV